MTPSPLRQECLPLHIPGLTEASCAALTRLVSDAQEYLDDDLVSIILYGSGADGKLRATSDINLLFVLTRFTQERVDPLREAMRLARAGANTQVMFVLKDELAAAAEAFAMKFADIALRHLLLFGEDVVAELQITREAKLVRLRQVLLNIAIRLRERYAMTSLREEQLALVLADITGPLRVAAATLLELQGTPAASAKAALETCVTKLGLPEGQQTLERLSTARETRQLPPGTAMETCFRVMAITDGLRKLLEGS